jgi:hypothetical protein
VILIGMDTVRCGHDIRRCHSGSIWSTGGHLTKGKFMYAKTSSSLSTVAWLGAMETKRQSRTSPPPPSTLLAIVS